MRKSSLTIISLLLIVMNIPPLEIRAQSNPKISLLSADVFYIRTDSSFGSPPVNPKTGNVPRVMIKYIADIYKLKISVILHDWDDAYKMSLDVRLTSSEGKESIINLEKDISNLTPEEISDFERETVLNENAWYTIEIGDFSHYDEEGYPLEYIYDKSQIYVIK